MERYLSNPNVDKTVVNVIQVYEGGTGGTTVEEAQKNLDILDKSQVNVPGGLAISTGDGLFGDRFEGGVGDTPMIDGPSFVRTNQTNRFFITNYDINTDYEVSSSMGGISREGDILIFKSGPDVGVATIRVNNLEVKLDIYLAIINMPFIISPVSGKDDIDSKVKITTSQFITGEVGTFHESTDWQLSTTVTMDNIFKSVEKDRTYLTNWEVSGLQENVTYYIRFRYHDNIGNKSSWSEVTQFKTRQTFSPRVLSTWSDGVTFSTKAAGGGGTTGSVATPSITYPTAGTTVDASPFTVTSSSFSSTVSGDSHGSSDWEISSNSSFSTIVKSSYSVSGVLTSWQTGGLENGKTYYARVKHFGSTGSQSEWSSPISFTTTSIQVPGGNGVVSFSLPSNFVTESLPSKTNNSLIGILKSLATYRDIVTILKVNQDGTFTTNNIYAGAGLDAWDRPIGGAAGKVITSLYNADDSKYIAMFTVSDYQGEYGRVTYPYLMSNSTEAASFLYTGWQEYIIGGTVAASKDFSTIAKSREVALIDQSTGYYTGGQWTVTVGKLQVADNGARSYIKEADIVAPSGHVPTAFGMWINLSPDGNTLLVMAGYNFIYMHSRTNGSWSFVEKIQLPGAASNFDFSDDGGVLTVGSNGSFEAWVYTKKNGSWNNLQKLIHVGDVTTKKSYSTISSDGTLVTVNSFERYSKFYIYKRLADGEWGEIKVIDDQIPANGVSNERSRGLHSLSRDGKTVIYYQDGYNVTGSNGVVAEFTPVLKLAY